MAKGKSTRKYNKLLTARRNYFEYGTESFDHSIDPMESGITFWSEPVIKKHMTSWFTPEFAKPEDVDISGALNRIGNIPNKKSSFLGLDWGNPFKGNNSNDIKNSLTSAAGSAIGTIGGGLIGGGLQSTAGNVLSGLGNIAAAIPGPWGAVASAGFGGLSGIANRLFGSKLNEENIAKVQSNINALNAFQSNASDYDTLANNWSSAPTGMTFSNSFIGSDGVFSNKAKRMANRLRDQVSAGDLWVSSNLTNNAANIDKNQLGNLLARSAAYGGPIFAEGGTIHINPKNKGKFTETKRRTGKTTEELTHSKNPLTRKRAIFAQNARKWKHEDGGLLDLGLGPINQPNWATELSEINPELDGMIKARLALDSHFGNPTARRMTNYDTRSYTFPDGREGNVYVGSYDNYVTPLIQDVGGELKLIEDPWSKENWERSEAQSMKFESPRDAKYFAENYKRFAPMMSLYPKGEIIQNAAKWHHAFGGELNTQGGDFTNGIIYIDNGGSHESSPYEGVPMGVDSKGIPNLVEEGEVIYNDYVFSNRLKVPKAVRNKYKLRGNKPLTFADAALLMSKESEERPNDPISLNGLEALLGELAYTQEDIREKKQNKKKYAYGGELGNIFEGNGDSPNILTYPGGSSAVANANIYGDWANFRFGDTVLYDPNTRIYNSIYASDDFRNWAKTDPVALEFAKTWWGNKENAQNYFSKNKTAPTYDDLFVGTKGRKALMYDAPFGNAQAYSDAHRYGLALFELFMNRKGKDRDKKERRYLTGQTDEAGTPLPDTLIEDWDPKKYEYVRTGSGFDADTDYTDYFYRKKATPTNRKVRFRDSKDGEWITYDSLDAATDAGIDLAEFGTPVEGKEFNSYTKLAPGKEMPAFDSWMRYAPIAGSLTGLGLSLSSKPDESGAEAILEASRGARTYQPIRFNPVGNYLTYNPLDLDYAVNQANAESGAARRAILNSSSGNRALAIAGILAADNNALNQLGALRRGAAEDNLRLRQLIEDFNRATNEFNSEGFFKADAANQSALAQARDLSLRGTMAAEDIRQRARLARENAIQANLSGLFTSMGNSHDNKSKGGKIKRKKKGLTY